MHNYLPVCLFGIGHFTRVPETPVSSTDEVENAYTFLNQLIHRGGGLEKKRLLVRRFRFNRVPLLRRWKYPNYPNLLPDPGFADRFISFDRAD